MDLMTPEGGTIVWTAVIFILLVFVLYKVAWKPILTILDEREQRIKDSLQAAAKARTEAEESAEKRLEIIQEAKKEAQKIITDAQHSAEKISQGIIRKSQQEAELLLARAKNEIDASRDRVMHEMRELAVQISMTATEKLIRKTLSREDHQKAIKESLEKMEDFN